VGVVVGRVTKCGVDGRAAAIVEKRRSFEWVGVEGTLLQQLLRRPLPRIQPSRCPPCSRRELFYFRRRRNRVLDAFCPIQSTVPIAVLPGIARSCSVAEVARLQWELE
jgi:hypothetical protein